MSDSVRLHRRQPTRLPRPWDSPGKNTGVGCHFLLQCMKVKSESEVAQSCPTLSDPMDCSLPGSSIHRIFQARVLEWVAIAFSKEKAYSPPTNDTLGFLSGPSVFSKLAQYLLSSFQPSFQYGFKICVVCVCVYLNGGECLQRVWKCVETVAPHFSVSLLYFQQFCSASLERHWEQG